METRNTHNYHIAGPLARHAAGALAAFLLLSLMSVAVDGSLQLPHLILPLLLTGGSFLVQIREDRAPAGPLRPRDTRLDYLRLLAVVGVITIHAIDALFPFLTTEVTGEMAAAAQSFDPVALKLDGTLRTCCLGFNLVYIMLSGALLIPWKEESLRDFYLKRFSKVFLPLLIYFFFYLWQNGRLYPLSPAKILEVFRMFFTADIDCSPFYWLIYIILSLYLIYPFMRYMMKDLPYSALCVLAAGIVLFSGTVAYTSFAFAPVIGSWLCYAILGYWITRPESRRFDRFLLPLGILQIFVIGRLVFAADSYAGYIGKIVQYTPIMVFLTLGYFSFVYVLPRRWLRDGKLLRFFGRYSFSVILLHWWVLYFMLGRYYPGFAANANGPLSGASAVFYRVFASGGLLNRLWYRFQAIFGRHASLVFLVAADVIVSLGVGALLEEYMLKFPLKLWDEAVRLVTRPRQRS